MSLDAARWEHLQALFHESLTLPEAERREWLEARCAADPSLVDEVVALLEEDSRDGSPLDRELADFAHAVLDGSVPALRDVGPYRILSVLGRGGMGVVYLGEREDLGKRVAIKVLRDAWLSPARRERFQREERTLAQLSHPSIARLYDADVLPDGTPYFVMEYVDGVPITDYCREHGTPLSERLRLFRAVCEAVQHAHRHAVIHRDLKPSNILVCRTEPGAAQVRLLDFGIAKPLEQLDTPVDQTLADLRVMTPGYAAPEQVRGEPVGTYTDIYALGVLLYELLTGEHPLDPSDRSPVRVEALILETEPEKPSVRARRNGAAAREGGARSRRLSAAAWADLDVLCLTAMHRDPHRRYATVEALLRDLEHYRKSTPLEARGDSIRYRAAKFLRRRRQPLTATAVGLVAMLSLVGFYTAQLAEERNRALTEARKAEQVSEYLIGLFEAGDPYAVEPGHPDALALLERGERQAEELADQPQVKAAMLNVLGRVHTLLSEYDRAEPLLQRALALRRQHSDPLDTAETLSNLGILYYHTGDYAAGEQAYREALALREKHLPPNHPDLASTLDNLGVIISNRDDYQASEVLYRLALRIRRAIYDTPHQDVANSLNNLAVNLYRQGQYTAAERYYREALDVERAIYGTDHPTIATTLANLGKLYEERGDFATADSMLTEALRVRRSTLGDHHFETALSLAQRATVLNHLGRLEQAEQDLRESLAIRERILAPGHPSIGTSVNGLASVLQRRGKYAEAGPLFERAVQIYRTSLGDRHRFTGVALCNLAQLQQDAGDPESAYRYFREGLSILEEVHPEDHQELAHNRSRFGSVLAALGRFPEAELVLVAAHRTLGAQLGSEHPRSLEAALRLVSLYEAWGRPEQGERYRLTAAGASTRP